MLDVSFLKGIVMRLLARHSCGSSQFRRHSCNTCVAPAHAAFQRSFQTCPGGTAAAVGAAGATASQQLAGDSSRVRLAVVGDVHGQWGPADAAALRALAADAVLWVGDIGNENVGLVQQIASLEGIQKAVILGNHDAWYTMTARGRQRSSRATAPSRNSTPAGSSTSNSSSSVPLQVGLQELPEPDRVQQQLDLLGSSHIGFGHMALAGAHISLVGARPFSKGGKSFSSIAHFMSRFDVTDMQQSAAKILEVINSQVPPGNVLVLMAHNGPSGLGAQAHNICGVDWLPEAGDHGDPDLQLVLQQLHDTGRHVALVIHGHMHHTLKDGARRQMVHIDPRSNTVFLNAATVPRVVSVPHTKGPHAATRHHFLLVELLNGSPHCAADVWVQVTPHHQQQAQSSTVQPASLMAPPHRQQRGFTAAAASATQAHASRGSSSKKVKAKKQKAKADQAAGQQAVLQKLQVQIPQQIQVDQQLLSVEGFDVQVAEVYEVLRTLGKVQSEVANCDQTNNGSTAAGRCWQYFDAFHNRWVTPAAEAGSKVLAAAEALPA